MKDLRPYQKTAIDNAIRDLPTYKRVCIVAPTGSGKSLMIASIAKRAMTKGLRVLVLAPKGFLIEQNVAEFKDQTISADNPEGVEPGIYCAGLNRKDVEPSVIFASRDSLGRSPEACGAFDVILCDECHGIPLNVLEQPGMYHKIFTAQPSTAYVIGLTATPWRLSGGLIYDSSKPNYFFRACSFEIDIDSLIGSGYLSPYVFPTISNSDNVQANNKDDRNNNEPSSTHSVSTQQTERQSVTLVDVSNTKVVRGDYREKELDDILGDWDLIDQCLDTWETHASSRRCTLFFCVSRFHAKRMRERLDSRLFPYESAYVDGTIIGKERETLLDDIKEGKYQAVINVGVLTEGFDAHVIDCIMFCRPTVSASLFIQMCVDTETEILTTEGFKSYNTIQSDDVCLTYDIDSQKTMTSKIKNITKRNVYNGERFISIDSKRSNLRVTGEHDLLVRSKSSKHFKKELAKDTFKRKDMFYYPVSAMGHGNDIDLSDDEIRFIGWAVSDCYIGNFNITISQSKVKYVKEIKDLLMKLNLPYREHIIKADTQSNFKRNLDNHRFTISKKVLEKYLKYIDKKLPYEHYSKFSERQFDIFIEEVIKADGVILDVPKDGRGQSYTQRSFNICSLHEQIESYQLLSVINGYSANIVEVRENCSILSLCKKGYRSIVGSNHIDRPSLINSLAPYGELVWCVETDQGTIITRRHGKITIMGNCGRGLRKTPPTGFPEKEDCLFLDVAGNFDRFKSIKEPVLQESSQPSKGSGSNSDDEFDTPVDTSERECMQCGATIPEGVVRCLECYDFKNRELDFVHDPYTGEARIYRVRSTHLEKYETKAGEKAIRVHYHTEAGHFVEYLLINRSGNFGLINRQKFKALLNLEESPESIRVKNKADSKYQNISVNTWSNINRHANKDNEDLCKHPWVEQQRSPLSGKNYMTCVHCSEGVAWNS